MIPVESFLVLVDNATFEILPRSLALLDDGMSFNADRNRHAVVAYHELPAGRIDALYPLRPPRIAHAMRRGETVDFTVILLSQDLDHNGNPYDQGLHPGLLPPNLIGSQRR